MPKKMSYSKEKNIKSGFTLVEISMGMVIMSLLFGSIIIQKRLSATSKIVTAATSTNDSPVNGIEDLEMWFETTSKSSFDKHERVNGAIVNTWYDINIQSTEKFHATSSGDPTYIQNGIKGLPIIRFDGVDDVFATSDINTMFKDEATIFMVAKITSDSTDRVIFNYELNQSSGTVRATLILGGGSVFRFDIPNTTLNGSTNITSASHIFTAYKSSTTQTIYIDGKSDATRSNSNSFAPGSIDEPFYIGARDSITTLNTAMDLGEIIIYSRALLPDEIDYIEDYLSRKWSIALSD